ncbi:hypothetical protein [Persicirhabdus sediminis]|uniref:Uncharacterized protein n=1 Tax=Persicirhabdus sediminis TaxID=454144 RepID=A0A8J7ME55_9BACT|nr:hypothetical protein [Persicirhabdus sediminis]MBK1791616.1 hypothetical protein [Persicirhabdus sediminis]
MNRLCLILPAILSLSACSPSTGETPSENQSSSRASQLSRSDKQKIGQKIWLNESGGKVSGLTAWNQGEEFPSLGIGHFIWYPVNYNGPYTESFPQFLNYAHRAGRKDIPSWLKSTPKCPWPNRTAFQADINGQRLSELRKFLANSVELQTDFIIHRSEQSLGKMMNAAPASQRARIQANYRKLATTSNGTYALIDYPNFKGDGTNPNERYKGEGWGLMQVLLEMRDVPSGQAAANEFAAAAKRRLDLRIKNSDPARGENRWRAGWHNRCDTYARPL